MEVSLLEQMTLCRDENKVRRGPGRELEKGGHKELGIVPRQCFCPPLHPRWVHLILSSPLSHWLLLFPPTRQTGRVRGTDSCRGGKSYLSIPGQNPFPCSLGHPALPTLPNTESERPEGVSFSLLKENAKQCRVGSKNSQRAMGLHISSNEGG